MICLFRLLANLFPVWVLGAALLALWHPEWFAWFATTRLVGQSLIVWGLAVIMLGMGLTLTVDDFRQVLHLPGAAALGVVGQFTIMPLAGWSIARFFDLPPALAAGLILTACCPGGTASNLVTYLARARVALSVLMTLTSTIAALVLTPVLTGWLAGYYVPVDRWGLFWDTCKIVVLPILFGVGLNHFCPRVVRWVEPAAPVAAAWTVALICASIVATSAETIRQHSGVLLLAVASLHGAGFAFGYALAWVFRQEKNVCRTISIEVGMQNSGLAVFLARNHFPDPLSAVPGAISSVFHSLGGSTLAGWWRWRENRAIGRRPR